MSDEKQSEAAPALVVVGIPNHMVGCSFGSAEDRGVKTREFKPTCTALGGGFISRLEFCQPDV
jgi:hypothetical protein